MLSSVRFGSPLLSFEQLSSPAFLQYYELLSALHNAPNNFMYTSLGVLSTAISVLC